MKTVRKPKLTEVVGIKKLLDVAAKKEAVLPRPVMELYETIRDFVVYVDDEGVAGCCALHIAMEDLAEIRSLVVRPDLHGQRIGSQLLEACLEEARALDIARVFALTRVPIFFGKHEFNQVDKHDLPHKVFQDCVRCPLFPDCDEVAVIRHLSDTEH